MKDAALSKGTKIAINSQIKEYGKMLKLNLDSTQKSIEIEVMLDGEHKPLKVHMRNYELRNSPKTILPKSNIIPVQ